ncbi:MAG TPA: hypothetical protein VEK11_00065 [Thermoanaerobaculia bacterium]|nr:hypothetical protein [Thermoanaerobaculia bacterium]
MKLSLSTLFIAVGVFFLAGQAAAQTCTPPGQYNGFPPNWSFYNHVRNGHGTSLDCWTYSPNGVSITSGTCGFSSTQGITFDGYSLTLSQSFGVDVDTGAGNGGTNWDFSYELDFDDPHNDQAWNWIEAQVWAVTPSGRTLVASDFYHGGNADVTCTQRNVNFNANMEDKTVEIIFKSKQGYTDVITKVRHIQLWQNKQLY